MIMGSSSPLTCAMTAIIMMTMMTTCATGISVRETFFQSEILPNCYKLDFQRKLYLLGQSSPQGPLGQSMENFISLIEKIEDFDQGRRLTGTRPDILARMLLSRFHIDEYNYLSSGVYYQENVAATRNRLTEVLLEASQSPTEPLTEEDWKTVLTSDEKCSMYFMLSHNVNRTALPSDRRTYMSSPVVPGLSYPSGNGRSSIPGGPLMRSGTVSATLMTEQAREYGVVGFRNHESHAIAPARVLLGIIAANGRQLQASSSEVLKQVGLEVPAGFRETMIDIPLITTLGEVWAYGAAPSTHEDREGINFAAAGTWNSTLCQVEYKLNTNHTKGSLAELRGAIDGYLLGMRSREVIAKGNFKLSSLLRQYYSPAGLFDDVTNVCNRRMIDTGALKDQVRNYLSVLLRASRIPTDESRVTAFVDMSQKEFENGLREASTPIREDADWCSRTRSSDPNGGICETPSDLVVVIDLEGNGGGESIITQMEIVRRLSNELDMRRYGSSMTVVAATRNGGYLDASQTFQSADTLSRIAYNTTNRACATCRLAFADLNNFGSGFRSQPDQLLKYLNATLRDLKMGKESMRAAPGRPVLFFNYATIKKTAGDQRSLQAAQWDLRVNHRDVPLLMAGEGGRNLDDLKAFAYDDKRDVFTIDPDVRGVTEMLTRRICETPAVIQHPSCRYETSSGMTSTGFITRGRKQYWAMYPEYFLKSYNIVFEFKALNGPIKVCYRRGYEKPEEDERNCEKLDPKGVNTRIIRSANPCYKFTLSNCPAFYFTIIAPDEGTSNAARCLKEQCLNMDQVEWTLTHTGVSCNSIGKLFSSIPIVFLLMFASYHLRCFFLF